MWIGRDEETPRIESLLAEARAHGVAIVHETRGADFDWGGVDGEVLWPEDAAASQKASNDDSLVMRLGDGHSISCCRATLSKGPKTTSSTKTFRLRQTF